MITIVSADHSHRATVTPTDEGTVVTLWRWQSPRTRLGTWVMDGALHVVLDHVEALLRPLHIEDARLTYDNDLRRVVYSRSNLKISEGITMAMFSRRHYEWLAHWAGNNLSRRATQILSSDLAETDPHFREDLFMQAYVKIRNLKVLQNKRRQQYIPRPHEAVADVEIPGDLDDLL